jgi:hypothetical protein
MTEISTKQYSGQGPTYEIAFGQLTEKFQADPKRAGLRELGTDITVTLTQGDSVFTATGQEYLPVLVNVLGQAGTTLDRFGSEGFAQDVGLTRNYEFDKPVAPARRTQPARAHSPGASDYVSVERTNDF